MAWWVIKHRDNFALRFSANKTNRDNFALRFSANKTNRDNFALRFSANKTNLAGYEILTAIRMKITVFCNVTT
jgi:hypothetical protein